MAARVLTESDRQIVELVCRGCSAAEISRRLGRYGERQYQLILQGKRRPYIRQEAERISQEFGERFRKRIQAARARALELLHGIIGKGELLEPTMADVLAATEQIATHYPLPNQYQQHAERGITAGEAILLIHAQAYPDGHRDVDSAELLRTVFDEIQRRDSRDKQCG